ncbi:MAG: non-heme iron oxygenase ferredoxin subunit [Limnochordaceae bacterium]|nr:non-heme iron oxygenase ferredoxin subunit [Limnochordaceae bacterium]
MAFRPVLPIDELPPGAARRVDAGGQRLALWHTAQGVFATDDTCTHERASLSEGDFDPDEGTVACPKHGARFHVASGRALTLPAYKPLRTYPVKIDGGHVMVDLGD